ncbi:ATP-binding cassette domain-containing protein [Enterococcus sp. 669A]|uniref:ATP-binding cassette domain-containing protein n=1 Tax=Candidatus Enterococcus moelleringii TaxID=2815325 RepID=A0ABS3LC44_9ENTE|nr:ATP-binding cassette domain-containing protein [Enterococcus sp. 669A]MBO1307199.1 ATP-binding cassette domain-containing protein [Enterococcus sp. 669A]
MSNIIEIKQVSKTFKGQEVVSNVTMNIRKNEIYGFLGPNGAGKTTIMKMILNLVKPTEGEIHVEDKWIQKKSYSYLKKIGNMIETPVFYQKLTAKENLVLHGEYMGENNPARILEVLRIVGLETVGEQLVTEFSLGMRQRLGIARAILTNPEILILDEPINGLDPIGIKEIRELLVQLKEDFGMTILISSHIVSEIEWIADTIGVINQGKLVKEVQLSEIKERSSSRLMIEVDAPARAVNLLQTELSLRNVQQTNNLIYVYDKQADQALVTQVLVQGEIKVSKIERQQETLEEYFLNIIKGDA